MNKFIFTTHEILSVIRNVSLKDFNPTCLDGQQLNEMVCNIENHCLGILTKYMVVRNPLTVSRWHAVFSELINPVYNEIGRARAELHHHEATKAVELVDRIRIEIERITDTSSVNYVSGVKPMNKIDVIAVVHVSKSLGHRVVCTFDNHNDANKWVECQCNHDSYYVTDCQMEIVTNRATSGIRFMTVMYYDPLGDGTYMMRCTIEEMAPTSLEWMRDCHKSVGVPVVYTFEKKEA